MNTDAYIQLPAINKQSPRVQTEHAASGEPVMLSWTVTQGLQTLKLLHLLRSARIRSLRLPH